MKLLKKLIHLLKVEFAIMGPLVIVTISLFYFAVPLGLGWFLVAQPGWSWSDVSSLPGLLCTLISVQLMMNIGLFSMPMYQQAASHSALKRKNLMPASSLEFVFTKPVRKELVYLTKYFSINGAVLLGGMILISVSILDPEFKIWFKDLSGPNNILTLLQESFSYASIQKDYHEKEEGIWLIVPYGKLEVVFLFCVIIWAVPSLQIMLKLWVETSSLALASRGFIESLVSMLSMALILISAFVDFPDVWAMHLLTNRYLLASVFVLIFIVSQWHACRLFAEKELEQ